MPKLSIELYSKTIAGEGGNSFAYNGVLIRTDFDTNKNLAEALKKNRISFYDKNGENPPWYGLLERQIKQDYTSFLDDYYLIYLHQKDLASLSAFIKSDPNISVEIHPNSKESPWFAHTLQDAGITPSSPSVSSAAPTATAAMAVSAAAMGTETPIHPDEPTSTKTEAGFPENSKGFQLDESKALKLINEKLCPRVDAYLKHLRAQKKDTEGNYAPMVQNKIKIVEQLNHILTMGYGSSSDHVKRFYDRLVEVSPALTKHRDSEWTRFFNAVAVFVCTAAGVGYAIHAAVTGKSVKFWKTEGEHFADDMNQHKPDDSTPTIK